MPANEVRRISVIGAGLMGSAIAAECAVMGFEVALFDASRGQGVQHFQRSLEVIREARGLDAAAIDAARARTRLTNRFADAADNVQLVIESIREDLDMKRQLFAELEAACPPDAILASNSSSFMPSEMAAQTKRPDRVIGAHYFNPPYLIPLVEVIRGPRTSDATTQCVVETMKRLGKTPVVLEKEVPGFIGNRLQAAVWREALHLIEQGVATAADIDQVMRLSIGRRWSVAGPLEVIELAGLDLLERILAHLLPALAANDQPPAILRDKVRRGEIGVKSGQGFHEWTPESADALRRRIAHALTQIDRWQQTPARDQ